MNCGKTALIAAGVIFGVLAGMEASAEEPATSFTAYASLTEGQILKGQGTRSLIDHNWIQSIAGGITANMAYNKNIRGVFRGDAVIDFSFDFPQNEWQTAALQDMKLPRYTFMLRHAEGVYTAGDGDSARYPFQAGVGLFPYKYNPDVRNLGEYLFRGNAYPNYFYNEFDMPAYRMSGVRVSTRPVQSVTIDGLLTSEIILIPQGDFSLAFTGRYNLMGFLDVGAGVDFYRLFSVSKYTTPKAFTGADANIYTYTPDSTYDSIMGQWNKIKTDITYYSYKATKAMFRFSLDPKRFIPGPMLGSEDLRIYGEIGLLGLKNYDKPTSGMVYYGKLSERTPMMIGFNVPAFKLLDVLSIELERYKSPYIPSYYAAFHDGLALPVSTSATAPHPVKWSLYAKKRLAAFTMVGQIARDHYQPFINNASLTEFSDAMPFGDNWWWVVKVYYGL